MAVGESRKSPLPRPFGPGPPSSDRLTILAMNGKVIAVAVVAGAVITAAPAIADDDPAAGSACSGNELNNTATASDGTALRCLANEQSGFSWMPDTGAAGTIGRLENEGYTVTITRIGSGALDQCKVTEIRNPNTITRTNRSHPGASGVTTITVSKTIDVTLDCT